jgi:hypothetical protein
MKQKMREHNGKHARNACVLSLHAWLSYLEWFRIDISSYKEVGKFTQHACSPTDMNRIKHKRNKSKHWKHGRYALCVVNTCMIKLTRVVSKRALITQEVWKIIHRTCSPTRTNIAPAHLHGQNRAWSPTVHAQKIASGHIVSGHPHAQNVKSVEAHNCDRNACFVSIHAWLSYLHHFRFRYQKKSGEYHNINFYLHSCCTEYDTNNATALSDSRDLASRDSRDTCISITLSYASLRDSALSSSLSLSQCLRLVWKETAVLPSCYNSSAVDWWVVFGLGWFVLLKDGGCPKNATSSIRGVVPQ